MTKAKEKRPSLRMQLRDQAAAKLADMESTARILVEESVKPVSKINPMLVMQLACQPSQTKTLRHKLITELANEAEAKLVEFFNKQEVVASASGDKDAD